MTDQGRTPRPPSSLRSSHGREARKRPRVAVVGVPGAWSSDLLADAFAERTGHRLLVDPREIVLDLGSGTATCRDMDLLTLDALVVKKVSHVYGPEMLDRLEVLRYIAERGVPVFSRPLAMLRVADRLACTVALASAGIPMPPTVVTEDLHEAQRAIRRFGTAVLKPLFSTKGRGMRLLSGQGDVELTAELEAFRAEGNPVFYVQKKVPIPGQDLGVVFVGGSYMGTYARVRRADSWSTTTANGGRYEPYEPPPEVIEMAHRAQLQFGLDFTGVDVVETESGPLVFEVSAFGGFRGLRDGLGIDPAGRYADHVLGRIGEAAP